MPAVVPVGHSRRRLVAPRRYRCTSPGQSEPVGVAATGSTCGGVRAASASARLRAGVARAAVDAVAGLVGARTSRRTRLMQPPGAAGRIAAGVRALGLLHAALGPQSMPAQPRRAAWSPCPPYAHCANEPAATGAGRVVGDAVHDRDTVVVLRARVGIELGAVAALDRGLRLDVPAADEGRRVALVVDRAGRRGTHAPSGRTPPPRTRRGTRRSPRSRSRRGRLAGAVARSRP